MADQLSYAGRAPFIYGNPPMGYDRPEQALQARDMVLLHLLRGDRELMRELLFQAVLCILSGRDFPQDGR